MPYVRELLEKYQVRKTKEQKSKFIAYACEFAHSKGYTTSVEGKKEQVRNIVIGDVSKAKVVYTAHYDTPAVMPLPNFITPKNVFVYVLYQIFLIAVMIAVPLTVSMLIQKIPAYSDGSLPYFVFLYLYYLELFIMLYGPANKNNANDNTSGVATVLGLVQRLSGTDAPVAFILFDCEEKGLLGSKMYNKQHKEQMKDKLVINFDCVSDGEYMMFVARKGARENMPLIEQSFISDEKITCLYETKGVIYPSDQNSFPVAVGVAAMKRTRHGLLYTDRIHTSRDTVFRESNIDFLVSGGEALIRLVCAQGSTRVEN